MDTLKRPVRAAWIGGAATLVLSLAAFFLLRRGEAPPVLGTLPEFTLTDQTGAPFSSRTLRTPWVASFIFSECQDQCPMVTAQLVGLRRRLPGATFVSFSVDPEDTPEDLANFAGAQGADWTFLQGGKEEMLALVEKGFRVSAGAQDLATHSSRLVLIDGQGRLRGYYDSAEKEARETLIRHLQLID